MTKEEWKKQCLQNRTPQEIARDNNPGDPFWSLAAKEWRDNMMRHLRGQKVDDHDKG